MPAMYAVSFLPTMTFDYFRPSKGSCLSTATRLARQTITEEHGFLSYGLINGKIKRNID